MFPAPGAAVPPRPWLVPPVAMAATAAYLLPGTLLGRRPWDATALAVAAAGVLALLAALVWPARRRALAEALGATACVFIALRLAHPWQAWLAQLPLGPGLRYWLVAGPGGGLLGLLPAAALLTLLGRPLFALPPRAQWGGRAAFPPSALGWGVPVGLAVGGATLTLALLAGGGQLGWVPPGAGFGVNLASNACEEILARGLLLQVVARRWGRGTAIVWATTVFALMHGLGAQALAIALVSWPFAWAVLRARSLWAGWVAHQVADTLIDTLLRQY